MSFLFLFFFVSISLIVLVIGTISTISIGNLKYLLLAIFLYIVVFRDVNATADTLSYVEDFESITTDYIYNTENIDTIYHFEIGYTLFEQAVKYTFGNSINWFFFIVATLQLFFFRLGILNLSSMNEDKQSSTSSGLSYSLWLLYISVFGLMYSGIVLRAGIAITCFFWGTSLMMKHKYIYGFIVCTLTLLIHRSAFLGYIAWIPLILNLRIGKKVAISLLVVTIILYLGKFHIYLSVQLASYLGISLELLDGVGSKKFSNYLGRVDSELTSYSSMILFNLILSLYLVLKIKLQKTLIHKLVTINILCSCTLAILSGIPAVTRVFDFFLPYSILLYYIYLHGNYKGLYEKVVIISIIIVVYSINFYRLAVLPFQ